MLEMCESDLFFLLKLLTKLVDLCLEYLFEVLLIGFQFLDFLLLLTD